MKRKNRKYISIITGLAIALCIAIFSAVQLIVASPGTVPNPGHPWDQLICDSNFCVDTINGRVGIGTETPGAKLEVSGDIQLSGVSPTYKLTNLATPITGSDAATKDYVDAQAGGETKRKIVYTNCRECMSSGDDCSPVDPSLALQTCPAGYTEVQFRNYNTPTNNYQYVYGIGEAVHDGFLSCYDADDGSCYCSAYVTDDYGNTLNGRIASMGGGGTTRYCRVWCAYRVCLEQ